MAFGRCQNRSFHFTFHYHINYIEHLNVLKRRFFGQELPSILHKVQCIKLANLLLLFSPSFLPALNTFSVSSPKDTSTYKVIHISDLILTKNASFHRYSWKMTYLTKFSTSIHCAPKYIVKLYTWVKIHMIANPASELLYKLYILQSVVIYSTRC